MRWIHLILITAAVLHGCSAADARSLLESIGARPAESRPPVDIDALCDRTVGSTCGEHELRTEAVVVANAIADRPGSEFRLWLVTDPAATRPVFTLAVPEMAHGSVRQRRRERERFVTESVDAIVRLASFEQSVETRRSPIAESLTRIAGFPTNRERHIVLISDLRERTTEDFECRRRLPTEQAFTRGLAARGLLLPHSLEGVRVHGAFVEARTLPAARCTTTPLREAEIARLWTSAIRAAGASFISFRPGTATLGPESEVTEASGSEEP